MDWTMVHRLLGATTAVARLVVAPASPVGVPTGRRIVGGCERLRLKGRSPWAALLFISARSTPTRHAVARASVGALVLTFCVARAIPIEPARPHRSRHHDDAAGLQSVNEYGKQCEGVAWGKSQQAGSDFPPTRHHDVEHE
jgi:hypothetical protein